MGKKRSVEEGDAVVRNEAEEKEKKKEKKKWKDLCWSNVEWLPRFHFEYFDFPSRIYCKL